MASAPVRAGGLEHALDVEIALAGGRGADQDGLVGLARMRPVRVGLGVDGDGADAEGAAGAEDAARDLSAVGDEDALEHAQAGWDCSILTRSTAPTRQPAPPCSQRALSVTAPLVPLEPVLHDAVAAELGEGDQVVPGEARRP